MRYLNARNTAFGEDRKIYSTVDSTATAGQTVFNVAYDQGRVAVFLNGIRLVPVQDYTYTLSGIGSNITLGAGITANDYLELIGLQGINAGNVVTEDNFVVGTSSTGSGGGYTNSTTVFPVSSSSGDLVSVWRNGIKLVPTTDFTVDSSASEVELASPGANTADEITVHVVGILQHSNFVQTTGGTFTGTVAHTGTLNVSGGTLTTSTAQKTAIVDGGKGNLTKSDVGLSNVTNDAQVPASGGTFTGNVGIGASSPVAKMEIEDGGTSQGYLMKITADDQNPYHLMIGNDTYSTTDSNAFGFLQLNDGGGVIYNAGSERMRITSSGKVGVGTDSSDIHTGKLNVKDGTSAVVKDLITVQGYRYSPWQIRVDDTTNAVSKFQVGFASNTEALSITDGGQVTITDGDLKIGTAGHGIDFSNSSSSYGISGEVLKHAESGTWTPTTKIGSTTQSLTGYSVAYDKIGNFVFAHGYVRFTANGTGRISIALPINPNSAIAIGGGYWFDLGTGKNNPVGPTYPVAGDQHLLFLRPGFTNRNNEEIYLQHSDFDGNRYIYFSSTYRKA